MKRFRIGVPIVLILALVWPSVAAWAASSKPRPPRKRPRTTKARTRNNRAGRDMDATKTDEQKAVCPDSLKGTCPGTFSLVYTFVSNSRPRRGDNPTDLRDVSMAFNVYVTRRIFLEIDSDHAISQKALAQPRAIGVGDAMALVGADVVLEGNRTPGVAVLYGVKIPIASATKGLGNGQVDQQIAMNIHKTMGRNYFEYDAGLIVSRLQNGESGQVVTLGTPAMSGIYQRALNRRNLLHVQLDATLPGHGYKGDLSALSFWQRRVNEHVSFRLGALTGLTSNTPRIGFYGAFVLEDNLRRWGKK